MMDVCSFEERSAILEFCAGMSRFEAETSAARAQGVTRWEALRHAERERDIAAASDHDTQANRNSQGDMSKLQP
jgi:hypothetical protein